MKRSEFDVFLDSFKDKRLSVEEESVFFDQMDKSANVIVDCFVDSGFLLFFLESIMRDRKKHKVKLKKFFDVIKIYRNEFGEDDELSAVKSKEVVGFLIPQIERIIKLKKDSDDKGFRKVLANFVKNTFFKKGHLVELSKGEESLFQIYLQKDFAGDNKKRQGFLATVNDEIAKYEQARNRIAESNVLLVPYVVNRKIRRVEDREKFFSGAYFSLIRAIDMFDRNRGFRLSTSVIRVIKRDLMDSIAGDKQVIATGSDVKYKIRVISRHIDKYYQLTGRKPTSEELAKLTGFSQKIMKNALNATKAGSAMSINRLVGGGDGDTEIGSLLADEQQEPPSQGAVVEDDKRFMLRCIDSLSQDRYKYIIRARHGFFEGGSQTLEEVGVVLGLTKERVRQLEETAEAELKFIVINNGESVKKTKKTKEDIFEVLPEGFKDNLGKLSSRQREVIEMLTGLHGNKKHDIDEIAKALGTTKSNVGRVKDRAIDKLKILSEGGEMKKIRISTIKVLPEGYETNLDELSPRQREIINMLMGLDGNKKHNEDEIAKALGISKGNVGSVKSLAIKKLKALSEGGKTSSKKSPVKHPSPITKHNRAGFVAIPG